MADFTVWDRATLEKFCVDVTDKLKQQEDEIAALKADLKTAMNSYREMLRR